MKRFSWLIPAFMVVLAAAAFLLSGLTLAGAVLAALLVVCPVILLYGTLKMLRRPIETPPERPPETQGMPFDWAAPVYDWYCPKIGLGKAFRQMTVFYAGIRPGEKVLDVGCGTGVLTRLAAEAAGTAGQAVGIDPGPKMIGLARASALNEGSRADFRIGVIEDLPFKDDTFDCVLSSLMIHHLPPGLKAKGLSEVHRVLKPGGRLLAVDIGRPSFPPWWLFFWPLLFWKYTKDHLAGRLERRFKEAGFERVEAIGRWMGLLTFWAAFKERRP